MRGTNLEVARAALRGVEATNHGGSLRAIPNPYPGGLLRHAVIRYHDYLLAWASADRRYWFINHETTGQLIRSNRRERDLAHTNSTQQNRATIRKALREAGYRLAEQQPEPHYERWALREVTSG